MTLSIHRIRFSIFTLMLAVTVSLFFPVTAGNAKEVRTASGKILTYPSPKVWKNFSWINDRKVRAKIKKVITKYKTGLPEYKKDRISRHILKQSKKYGYDPLLITAVIITESSFNHRAKSKVGALGLMQIRPRTGKAMASETNIRWRGKSTLYHPEKNIALGSFYLDKLVKRFGKMDTALEAYNHGPTRIARYLKRGKHPRKYSGKVFSIYHRIKYDKAVG